MGLTFPARVAALIVVAVALAACKIGDHTYRWTPQIDTAASTRPASAQGGQSAGQPTRLAQSSMTIIDEFHNNAVAAAQKYQQYHEIPFAVADLSVSGDTAALSYVGQTSARSDWARQGKFQGWNQWMEMTQQPFYTVTCLIPVKDMAAFPNLTKGKNITVRAKLKSYSAAQITLNCTK